MKKFLLTHGRVTLVDDEDFDYLDQFHWFFNHGYAAAWVRVDGKRKQVYLHRLLMGFPQQLEVDHINRNRLDNRKSNLRLVTRSQNLMNRPARKGLKGVSWHKRNKKWQALIGFNYKQIYLGFFTTEEAAAKAYQQAANLYFGEFASK